ncbi:ankyrin repeat-containing domain protein [Trichoderma chlorosporum]
MSEEQWKFTSSIYLVGFPDANNDPTANSIAAHLENSIPKARIFKYSIFGAGTSENSEQHSLTEEITDTEDEVDDGSNDSSYDGTGVGDRTNLETPRIHELEEFSAGTVASRGLNVEREAVKLLCWIQQNTPPAKTSFAHSVVLAGYGFGGFVVKKAVAFTHSYRNFYALALAIDTLVFFNTPHQLTEQLCWEGLLIKQSNAIDVSFRQGLLDRLPDLRDSVSQLSNDFYQFAAKYKITNVLGKDSDDVSDCMQFNSPFEEVISGPQFWGDISDCKIQDMEFLKSMERAFTPRYVDQGYGLQPGVRIDYYFELLRRLSPSRWLMHKNTTMTDMDDLEILAKIYDSLLKETLMKSTIGQSIEIVSPDIHVGSVLLKLICRNIIKKSDAVIIESNIEFRNGENTKRNMYMSFLRQILLQRPLLFVPIQSMVIEIMSQNIWTEEILRLFLSSILTHTVTTDFIVVIDDFESRPVELHDLLAMMRDCISETSGSRFSILTCSQNDITNLSRDYVQKIPLRPEMHGIFMNAFVRAKVDQLFGQNIRSTSAGEKAKADVLQSAISLCQSSKVSFSNMSEYLSMLLLPMPFPSINRITDAIQGNQSIGPYTLLSSQAGRVLSWLLFAVRPLHIEELAVAFALGEEHHTLKDVRKNMPLNMERDIRNSVGILVKIEGQFVSLANEGTKKELQESDDLKKKLGLLNEADLVQRSLRYLNLVLNSTQWENCLSQTSVKHGSRRYEKPELGLMEYVCRFWPTHLHHVKVLKETLQLDVIDFLNNLETSNKWFKLYLLYQGEVFNPFTENVDVQGTALGKTYICRRQSAIEMAAFVGLSTIIPSLSPGLEKDMPKAITIRRGYWDHQMVVLVPGSADYLYLIIDNDDALSDFFRMNRVELVDLFPLHMVAISGCLRAAELLFNHLSNHVALLSQINSYGRTPFHMAALGGSEEVLQFLISKATSDDLPVTSEASKILDIKDDYGQTALMIAAKMGNVSAAKIMIKSGAGVNIQDDSGRTAMHFAVSNCPQIITCLVDQDNGAAFIPDQNGCIPLHLAIKFGSEDAALLLLNASRWLGSLSQAMSAKDYTGKTALQYAAERDFHVIARYIARKDGKIEAEMCDIQRAAELAAMNGHLTTLQAITDEVEIGSFGHRILNAAACSNQLLVVYHLLQNNTPLDKILDDGHTVLSNVSSKGLTQMVRILLEHGADANATDSKGRTPLHHAVKYGMHEIAEILLAHKPGSGQPVEVEVNDLESYKPLHYAARAADVKMVELLLRNNARIDGQSVSGETPLHLSLKNPEMMRFLIGAGANPGALDYHQRSPLHLAVGVRSLESVQILLEKGASWDAMDYQSKSPLAYAMEANESAIVEAILQSQGGPKQCLQIPWSDLASPFKASTLKTVKILLKYLPDIVERRDKDGGNLLHLAAKHCEVGTVALLVDAGVDVNWLDNGGETPVFHAVKSNKTENLRFLIKHGGKINKSRADGNMPLHIAAYLGNVENVTMLLEEGAKINIPGIRDATPLYMAVQQNMTEIVRILLEKGADPNITASGGWSPLQAHIVSDSLESPKAEICDLLISSNANVNHRTDGLETALHLAIERRNEYAMKALLEKGADPNLANNNGLTPFHLSFDHGLTKSMLVHSKADSIDLTRKTRSWLTSMHLAIMKSESETVRLMLHKGVDFKAKTIQELSCLDFAAGRDTLDILETLLNRDWDIVDLTSAYWSAVRSFKFEYAKILVRKLDELPNKGLSSLEARLLTRPRIEAGQDTSQTVSLLEKESKDSSDNLAESRMSILELCMFSQAKVNTKLLQAYYTCLSQSTAFSRLGFRELRAATEVERDQLDIWHRLRRLIDLAKDEKDQDGWNLDHFVYQAGPRESYGECNPKAIRCSTKTPSALIAPTLWYTSDTGIEPPANILLEGLDAEFTSK